MTDGNEQSGRPSRQLTRLCPVRPRCRHLPWRLGESGAAWGKGTPERRTSVSRWGLRGLAVTARETQGVTAVESLAQPLRHAAPRVLAGEARTAHAVLAMEGKAASPSILCAGSSRPHPEARTRLTFGGSRRAGDELASTMHPAARAWGEGKARDTPRVPTASPGPLESGAPSRTLSQELAIPVTRDGDSPRRRTGLAHCLKAGEKGCRRRRT